MIVNDHIAIRIDNVGKMYKLFPSQRERIREVLGINHLLFWRKTAFHEFWALRGINLTIRKGERVGIIGHNGAGKSTLLKTLIGAHAPTEGSIQINGRIQALMQLGTGFHPDFTGRENIRASLGYNNLTAKAIRECEEEIIDFIELDEFIDQPVKSYSAGMYARLAFATATAIKPEILIIDEVLGAGDAYFAGKCVERMKRLSVESGATVLFVSHDLSSVQNMCDRCIWIDRGILRGDGSSLDVIKAYSAQVRQREEMRLKIRNQKKIAAQKSVDVDYSRQQIFRFRSKNGSPLSLTVSKIAFLYQNVPYAEVCPGQPMDSDQSHNAFIYINNNSLGWGHVQSINGNHQRQITLDSSKEALFGLIVQDDWKLADLQLELEYQCESDESPILEIFMFDTAVYSTVGKLVSTQGHMKIKFDESSSDPDQSGSIAKNIEITPNQPHDVYGSEEVVIRSVHFLTEDGHSFMIRKQSSLSIEFKYECFSIVDNPIFVFVAYLSTGQPAMQIYHSFSEAGKSVMEKGKGVFFFKIDKLNLGAGKYIASAAIFKDFPQNGNEPPAYSLIDRKIEFEVYSPVKELMTTGICIQYSTPQIQLVDISNES